MYHIFYNTVTDIYSLYRSFGLLFCCVGVSLVYLWLWWGTIIVFVTEFPGCLELRLAVCVHMATFFASDLSGGVCFFYDYNDRQGFHYVLTGHSAELVKQA